MANEATMAQAILQIDELYQKIKIGNNIVVLSALDILRIDEEFGVDYTNTTESFMLFAEDVVFGRKFKANRSCLLSVNSIITTPKWCFRDQPIW